MHITIVRDIEPGLCILIDDTDYYDKKEGLWNQYYAGTFDPTKKQPLLGGGCLKVFFTFNMAKACVWGLWPCFMFAILALWWHRDWLVGSE